MNVIHLRALLISAANEIFQSKSTGVVVADAERDKLATALLDAERELRHEGEKLNIGTMHEDWQKLVERMCELGPQYKLTIGAEEADPEDDDGLFMGIGLYFNCPDGGWSDEELKKHFGRIHPGDRYEDRVISGVAAGPDPSPEHILGTVLRMLKGPF